MRVYSRKNKSVDINIFVDKNFNHINVLFRNRFLLRLFVKYKTFLFEYFSNGRRNI